jgi:formamidopyrimidine-DNA glycosylase
MPELPEVETTMSGLKPHLEGAKIEQIILRHHQLRWPIPALLQTDLNQKTIQTLSRRGKYILIKLTDGTLIIHLGMSGSLRMVKAGLPHRKHDHMDCILTSQMVLRYHDPRRFGAILWTSDDPYQHPLLKLLGVEPLSVDFTAKYLKDKGRKSTYFY